MTGCIESRSRHLFALEQLARRAAAPTRRAGRVSAPGRVVHIFRKPNVTRIAAQRYEFPFHYKSKPKWKTYESLLDFAKTVKRDNIDLRPRDMIDLQGFIWVAGSDEYD